MKEVKLLQRSQSTENVVNFKITKKIAKFSIPKQLGLEKCPLSILGDSVDGEALHKPRNLSKQTRKAAIIRLVFTSKQNCLKLARVFNLPLKKAWS